MAVDNKAKVLREGERYVQQGKIALAINEYLKIIKDDPDDVLTLNTLGDLYLRQRRVAEANQLFLRVADNYERNTFLLKAIAVFKKVLNTDPGNLHVLQLLASLYARQGMNVEACNQYMQLGDLFAREGRTNESLEAYEKVVEIDPMNSAILLRLAEAYLEQNNKEKAYLLFAGAARAQTKAGNVSDAMASFRRALAINWASSDALKGFLEAALQSGDLSVALEQIQECLRTLPEDPVLQALLGRVYQATGDLDHAEPCLHAAVKADDSQYTHLLALSKQFLQQGNQDRALKCLDPIIPVMIAHREIETLAHAYNLIITENPYHLQTLLKLADILSSTGDDPRYIGSLERIVQIYRSAGKPEEALKYAEKILESKPDSQAHFEMHRQLFSMAYPGKPYQLPRVMVDARHETVTRIEDTAPPVPVHVDAEDFSSSIVEIDLLLNYGLKEKALQLLRTLEKARPDDLQVRERLCTMYQESGNRLLAAQQHVLLSVLHRKSGNQPAADQSWSEAKSLAPEWAKAGLDISAFACERGINYIEPRHPDSRDKEPGSGLEVDLSGDLSDIFFQDANAEPAGPAEPEIHIAGVPDAGLEEFAAEVPKPAAPESADEQLQEVDFYIRLGFQDEARTKLEEIAAAFPGHPELASRFAQLGLTPVDAAGPGKASAPVPEVSASQSSAPEIGSPAGSVIPGHSRPDAAVGQGLESATNKYSHNNWREITETHTAEAPHADESITAIPTDTAPPASIPDPGPAEESKANQMFADLIDEVNSLPSQEITRDDYETHLNLGIAYHEMGLVEDAIKEFECAVKALDPEKSPKDAIRCCGMLSTCYLEKGMPRSVIRWCQTGLSIKEISSHETIALRYDMGVAHATAGESERALECFGMIFGIDPAYRDVAQRIDDLKTGLERNAP